MATDLHDRLSDLATHTPPGPPPIDLWDRGVRRRRVVGAGRVAVAVALAFLVGIGGWTWHASRTVEPADSDSTPHLPDHLYRPSPWLPSFTGPPGQLVALLPAERKSLFRTSPALVGVTASTGQYGFLKLPPYAVTDAERPQSPPSLSPDGRRVAFWTTGTPSGTPNTNLIGVTITGVAVYDTTTGQVRRAPLATEHGLNPSLLSWSDDHTLVLGLERASFGDGNPNSCCNGHWEGLATWDLSGSDGPTRLTSELPIFVDGESTNAGAGVLVTSEGGRRLDVIDPRPPGADQEVRMSAHGLSAAPSPDGSEVAVVSGQVRGRLLVGDLPVPGQSGEMRVGRVTPDDGFVRVVGWADDEHVVVRQRVEKRVRAAYRLVTVDVSTGRAHVLVHAAAGSDQWDPAGTEFARGLLAAPVVHATPPPAPWNRRGIAIALAVAFILLGLLIWGDWRGRRA